MLQLFINSHPVSNMVTDLTEANSIDDHLKFGFSCIMRFTFFLGIFVVLMPLNSFGGEDKQYCIDWFRGLGLKKNKDCEEKCLKSDTDSLTYMCPISICQKLCKANSKCEDAYWKKKAQIGRPPKWPNASEESTSFNFQEIEDLQDVLARVPEDFKKVPDFKGFYRMKRSVEFVNPATTFSGTIVLYDNAFHGPFDLKRVVIHELAHEWFIMASDVNRSSYLKAMGWHVNDKGEYYSDQSRIFFDEDSKSSPDEDFAHNIEKYFFDRENVEKKLPALLRWIKQHFSKNFSLKDNCRNGQ